MRLDPVVWPGSVYAAKGARSVMSGMVGMAMRHGAMTTNPTRDVAPISVQKKIVRA